MELPFFFMSNSYRNYARNGIQRTECLISGVVVKKEISKPDEEQSEILNLLGVNLM